MVTMRLQAIKGRTRKQVLDDTTSTVGKWVFNREYRVTYRDALIDSETDVAGTFETRTLQPGDSIFISMDEGFAERMEVGLGDALTFNVQGALMTVYVGHFRKIDWRRMQSNFLIVFPRGVLELAPQFHILMTHVPDKAASASFQQKVVQQYPNVSMIDLNLIIETLDDVLTKIAFVIRFMALFSIVTGALVLISSVMLSKYQRIQESVLLRTLGANKRMVLRITSLEYLFLGAIAAFVGFLIALAASWALAAFAFEIPFVPNLWPLLPMYAIITIGTLAIGLFNIRPILGRPPLAVLRG